MRANVLLENRKFPFSNFDFINNLNVLNDFRYFRGFLQMTNRVLK